MAIEVMLMNDVTGLGTEGDVVRVADGYARNRLFPKKLAAPVTDAARRKLAKMQIQREEQRKAQMDAARKQAAKVQNVSCTISVKTTEADKMYGSVTAEAIVESLKAQGVDVDASSILLERPIKELGVYDVGIRLHPEVVATVKVWIVEE